MIKSLFIAVLTCVLFCLRPASAATFYVAQSNPSPVPPYASWNTAATNIQDAINAATNGDLVLVTNGVYTAGGLAMAGQLTNRVALNLPLTVQSVNGPWVTVIQGAGATNGPSAVRCAWLTNGASLLGFTLQAGATASTGDSIALENGGGVWCASTNAVVANCVIRTNAAYNYGGGAYRGTLRNCVLIGNQSVSSGGGAEACNLLNCLITANLSLNGSGGGSDGSHSTNCAYTSNSSIYSGGAANGGSLINCTVSGNTSSGYSFNYGAAVYSATLVNCIVYGNFSRTSYPATNYASCTMTYCDSDPLPPRPGNMDVNPQLIADGIHLATTSPCIGVGTSSVVSGTDIDGQSWKTPPSMGCDEWYPAPVVMVPPVVQVHPLSHAFTISIAAAGQSPFAYFWSLNGTPLQDNGHFVNSGTASLTVNNFGVPDTGVYQVVVTNSSGSATSQVAQVVIHAVNAAGLNPVPPYSTWATAATNIQDAINVAAAGDIVLVTNGVYAYGGAALAGNLTNRVALTLPIVVTSVGGYTNTIIQGMWDPVSTNGASAVRCAYVGDGATLIGFTLQNGATRATGDGFQGGLLESGGGVLCDSTNGIVANCVLSNNCAVFGGGVAYGTAVNSLLFFNQAFDDGGGSYYATLNNCTVVNNSVDIWGAGGENYGAGTYYGTVMNCIVIDNVDGPMEVTDNFYPTSGEAQYFNSCTVQASAPFFGGNGNITANPSFLDLFHLATNSPCRGAGSSAYTRGTDLDGEPWANPPSMGCSEVVVSNLVGPLSVTLLSNQTNVLVNRFAVFEGAFTGHAALETWAFGDGQTLNTSGENGSHIYTTAGAYTVTYTVYNNDNPAGVSATTNITVLPLNMPQLQSSAALTNGFTFQFVGQASAYYTIQYTTNLTPPVVWSTLANIYYSSNGTQQVIDSAAPTGTRFYRVLAQ